MLPEPNDLTLAERKHVSKLLAKAEFCEAQQDFDVALDAREQVRWSARWLVGATDDVGISGDLPPPGDLPPSLLCRLTTLSLLAPAERYHLSPLPAAPRPPHAGKRHAPRRDRPAAPPGVLRGALRAAAARRHRTLREPNRDQCPGPSVIFVTTHFKAPTVYFVT